MLQPTNSNAVMQMTLRDFNFYAAAFYIDMQGRHKVRGCVDSVPGPKSFCEAKIDEIYYKIDVPMKLQKQ